MRFVVRVSQSSVYQSAKDMACRKCDLALISKLEELLKTAKLTLWQRFACHVMVFVFKYFRTVCRPTKMVFRFYGNWCGPNHSGPGEPIDEIDCACWEHDQCYSQTGGKSHHVRPSKPSTPGAK